MRCVAEACKREGKKLDVYRVPNNIDDIVSKLQREDEDLATDYIDQQNTMPINDLVQRLQAAKASLDSAQARQVIQVYEPESAVQESVTQAEKLNFSENNMVIFVDSKDPGESDLSNCYILLRDIEGNITQ